MGSNAVGGSGLLSCGVAPVTVEGAAKFCELVCGLVVERSCSSGVAFGLPQHAACLPQGGMPRAAWPHPGDWLCGLDPSAGLVETACVSVGDGCGHAEPQGTGLAHVAPFEAAVGALDAPGGCVRVRRGSDERALYPLTMACGSSQHCSATRRLCCSSEMA